MSKRAYYLALSTLFILFALLLIGRNRVRAEWWAWRLASTDDLQSQGYYLACLAGLGETAIAPVRSLAHSDRADVRALAIYALQKIPPDRSSTELARLLADPDLNVREAAATALVFMESKSANDALLKAARSTRAEEAAAAVSALGRIESLESLQAICAGATSHPSPLVRAQAIEALMEHLLAGPHGPTTRPESALDPIDVLIDSLADSGRFTGRLSLERQKEAVSRFVAARTATKPAEIPPADSRTVSEFASECMAQLTAEAPPALGSPSAQERLRLATLLRVAIDRRRSELSQAPAHP